MSAAFCKTVKTAGAYGDGRGGHGLTLMVDQRTGRLTKYWYQRLPDRRQGRQHRAGQLSRGDAGRR